MFIINSIILPPGVASVVDPDPMCRNFSSDFDGDSRPMMTFATHYGNLGSQLNYLLSRNPRRIFSQSQSAVTGLATVDTAGSSPLYLWRYEDNVTNARSLRFRMLIVPRTDGSGDEYAERATGAFDETVRTDTPTIATATAPEQIHYEELVIDRDGGWSVGEIEDGLRTFNGHTIVDIVAEEVPVFGLDPSVHLAIPRPFPGADAAILERYATDMCAALHEVHLYNRGPLITWSAQAVAGAWATPASSDATGFTIGGAFSTGEFRNIFDETTTSRTTSTPGVWCPRAYCGRGVSGSVKVQFKVLAAATAGTGEIKFIGPTHVGGNDTTIGVNSATPAWYGDSSYYVYLDTSSTTNDNATGGAKIDILAKRPGSGGTMYIYGLWASEVYE